MTNRLREIVTKTKYKCSERDWREMGQYKREKKSKTLTEKGREYMTTI